MFELGRFGSRIAAVEDGGRECTYSELSELAANWASSVPPRSVVFLLCANRLESLVAYVGALNAGVVPLLLDAHISRESLARLVACYDPVAIYGPEGGHGAYRWNWRQGAPSRVHDELALLLTTSGSTGSPKLVRISRRNLVDNFTRSLECLPYGEGDRVITTMPMNYTYGLSLVNLHLHVGGAVLLTERMVLDRAFWTFLEQAGATNMAGVPRLYELMFRVGFEALKLPCLRLLTVAGGRMSEALHRQLADYSRQTGKRLIEMYGQCEATTYSGCLPDAAQLVNLGAMGYALPGGRFSLVDAQGQELTGANQEGELVYEGGNVAMGYAESAADLRRGDEFHGRLFTGDLARRDERGCYFVIGRKKRFLKIFGNRIGLDDVEHLVSELVTDGEVAATGEDDRLRVFVTGSVAVARVEELLSQRLRLHPSAIAVSRLSAIPRNASGKVLYGDLPA